MYCGAVTDGSVILYQVKGNDFNTPREIAASRHAHGCSQNALAIILRVGQDDAIMKPTSLVAKTEMIPEAVKAALEGRQIQPILI